MIYILKGGNTFPVTAKKVHPYNIHPYIPKQFWVISVILSKHIIS